MKNGKLIFWGLALFALVCLSGAAVWLGGLNQDEGWYLYAANLVADGQVPYRDFFFTQGPLMPKVYSCFTWIWARHGLLGARVFTLALGMLGILFAALTARRLAGERGDVAALSVVFLLGCNLYHLYYLAIPKTYALAALFVAAGMWLLTVSGRAASFFGGVLLGLAAGVRISLGAILPVVGVSLVIRRGRWLWFGVGGLFGLALAYGLVAREAFDGLVAAQRYHASRGGFDPVWTVGSLSRLVRWYLPVFIVLGLGVARRRAIPGLRILLLAFLAVFAVQMLAPFPYEDYQVPVMGLLAVYAAVRFAASARELPLLLVLGLAYACSFGSPLLEKWMTNGQDRFWSLKKRTCELAQLREVARRIERLDPNGKTLLTQDLYLAIETNRRVPKGLEMGPFSILSDGEWRKLLTETAPAECAIAALSGYTFAIEPPACGERPVERQMTYWGLLKRNYVLVDREESFGQGATPLLLLRKCAIIPETTETANGRKRPEAKEGE